MARKEAYSKYNNIYEIAAGLEGTDGLLLSPRRAIFTAITGVLSLHDKKRKEELLGQDAYEYAKKVASRYDARDMEFFIDVLTEAKGGVYHGGDMNPFIRWDKEEQLEYMEREVFNKTDLWHPHVKNRFVAAKTREAYFPATKEFYELHIKNANINSAIWTAVVRGLARAPISPPNELIDPLEL